MNFAARLTLDDFEDSLRVFVPAGAKNPEAYVTLRHRHAQRPPESCIYLGAYYLNLQHGIRR